MLMLSLNMIGRYTNTMTDDDDDLDDLDDDDDDDILLTVVLKCTLHR